MKYLLSLWIIASVASAQNVAVRYLSMDPRHEFNQPSGCPTNWPVVVDFIGEKTTSPWTNRVVISEFDYVALTNSLASQFYTWKNGARAQFIRQQNEAAESVRAVKRAERATLRSELRGKTNVTPVEAAAVLEKILALMRLEEELGE